MIAGRTLAQWLARADALGAEGRFFEAHEELELAWKAAEGETKVLLQGLIQIAAGLHRLRLNPEKTDGATYLLDRGLKKILGSGALLTPDSVRRLEASVKKVRTAGKAPAALRFELKTA